MRRGDKLCLHQQKSLLNDADPPNELTALLSDIRGTPSSRRTSAKSVDSMTVPARPAVLVMITATPTLAPLVITYPPLMATPIAVIDASDLLTDAMTVKHKDTYVGKTKYRLQGTILDYDYFNITLTPVGLVVEDFGVASEVACQFRCRVDTPVLVVKGSAPRVHYITVPTFFDTRWLRLGAALSALGVVTMVAALALAIRQTHRSG